MAKIVISRLELRFAKGIVGEAHLHPNFQILRVCRHNKGKACDAIVETCNSNDNFIC
jgi:hypothetical protein